MVAAVIGVWLLARIANGSLITTTSVAEERATILTLLGGIIGTLGGVLIVAWFVASGTRSDRVSCTRANQRSVSDHEIAWTCFI